MPVYIADCNLKMDEIHQNQLTLYFDNILLSVNVVSVATESVEGFLSGKFSA